MVRGHREPQASDAKGRRQKKQDFSRGFSMPSDSVRNCCCTRGCGGCRVGTMHRNGDWLVPVFRAYGDFDEKIAVAILLMSTPAMADTVSGVSSQMPVGQANTVGQPSKCKPIGKTASGKLVYGMSCKDIPVGGLSGTGQSGFSDGRLQNSNPTGLPPSQTSGAPPTSTGGNTRPVTNGNTK